MKEYIEHLPIFFLMVFMGIFVNLLTKYRKDKKSITLQRVLEEMFSSIWISGIVAGFLDFFTNWSIF